MTGRPALGLAVVGAGYWGRKLARNVRAAPECELLWVCDRVRSRAAALADGRDRAVATELLAQVLDDERVVGVVIATPPATHASLALQCIEAGRHLLVEKPLAVHAQDGARVVAAAAAAGVVVVCDHTYCFAEVPDHLRRLVRSGALGIVRSVTSRRLGPGRRRPDVDVFWDLAAHDLAVLDHILPAWDPVRISARSASPRATAFPSAGTLAVESSCGTTAEILVSWTSPVKERLLVMAGSRRTAVWDDLDVNALRLSTALGTDASVEVLSTSGREPLARLVAEFAHSMRTGEALLSGGDAALRVLWALEAARLSLEHSGAYVPVLHDALWTVGTAAGRGA